MLVQQQILAGCGKNVYLQNEKKEDELVQEAALGPYRFWNPDKNKIHMGSSFSVFCNTYDIICSENSGDIQFEYRICMKCSLPHTDAVRWSSQFISLPFPKCRYSGT